MRRLCFVLLLLVLPTQAFAQSVPTPYKLRHPSADEYFAGAANLLEQTTQNDLERVWPGLLADTAQFRYLADAILSFEQIDQFIYTSIMSTNTAHSDMDQGAWYSALVEAWLNENSLNLDLVSHLSRNGYRLDIEPRDFKGDGSHEWLLTFSTSDTAYYKVNPNFLVAERLSSGRYRVARPPLPWFSEGFSYWASQNGTVQILQLADLNGDAVPEWVIVFGNLFNTGGTRNGEILILNWHDGRLVDLGLRDRWNGSQLSFSSRSDKQYATLPKDVSVEFVPSKLETGNIDIAIQQYMYDSWGCTWTQKRTFSWNGKVFSLTDEKSIFLRFKSVRCAMLNRPCGMER